jgi:ABC-type multidrug transport system fused ATPase/permease subunit
VIENRTITEIGTHLELCQRGGYYASLVERQQQGFLGESEPSRAA